MNLTKITFKYNNWKRNSKFDKKNKTRFDKIKNFNNEIWMKWVIQIQVVWKICNQYNEKNKIEKFRVIVKQN